MTSRHAKPQRSRRFAYRGLDRLIHERARLGILASLLAHPQGLVFGELLELCDLTDGNLSRHLRVLQSEKLVEVTRDFGTRRPQSLCRLTASGRKRLLDYLAVLEQVLLDASRALDCAAGFDVPPMAARG